MYEKAGDLWKAMDVLEEAKGVRPDEVAVLSALRAGYEALRQWPKVVAALAALAEIQPLLHDKAQRYFEQADVLLGRLRDEPAGLTALERALENDPTHDRALAALVAVLGRRSDFRALDRTYAKLVEAFAAREDVARAWDVCRKLGQLRRDKLSDGPGALEAFMGAVKLKPKDVETRAALAELLIAKGDRAGAIAELETAAQVEPARAETHRRLFEHHRRAGVTDRAWLAATALEALGVANVDQSVLAAQFRGEARPTSALDGAAWSLLRAPGTDAVIEEIVAAIAPSAIAVKVAALRGERRLFALDPERRQSPDSTATLVRTFAFASQVLGVKAPDLYLYDQAAFGGELAAVPAAAPSTVFGEAVMRGRKLGELSFLVARHVTYYRPEHYPLIFYPTLPEMSALVLAAVKLARPELPLPPNPLAAGIRKELAQHAAEADRAALAAAVEKLDARGGRLDLAAWIQGVELTANRAGLLLAGDLSVALQAMKGETRAVADLTFQDRRAHLIAFTATRALAELRAQIGVAAKASLPPPPPSRPADL
jgi:tetratricopeptide (TPR) repeat protein